MNDKRNKNISLKCEELPYDDNWKECEYIEACRNCRTGCDAKVKKEACDLWRQWKGLDLQEAFYRRVDSEGNYLLEFN